MIKPGQRYLYEDFVYKFIFEIQEVICDSNDRCQFTSIIKQNYLMYYDDVYNPCLNSSFSSCKQFTYLEGQDKSE